MLRQKKVQSPLRNAFDNITSEVDLECFELDLPDVVHAKKQLLYSRLFRRRPWLKELIDYPTLVPVDFNNLTATEHALNGILSGDDANAGNVSNIILFEGVMIYLDEGVPHSLLELCSNSLRKYSSKGYLCFADRLENIPGGDKDAAHIEMESTGWELMDWLSKPGLARHMGVARIGRRYG
jgi:O-methyltransferase involved in polyketide biosynthesis